MLGLELDLEVKRYRLRVGWLEEFRQEGMYELGQGGNGLCWLGNWFMKLHHGYAFGERPSPGSVPLGALGLLNLPYPRMSCLR